MSQRAGLAFEEFTEPEVKFPPTYKYKKYTTSYDKKEGKKCRAPAWCDRILYHQTARAVPDAVRVESYDHILKLSGSDHKPVFAVMNVRVKEYDSAKMKKTQLRVERELKKNENAGAAVSVAERGADRLRVAEVQDPRGAVADDHEHGRQQRVLPLPAEAGGLPRVQAHVLRVEGLRRHRAARQRGGGGGGADRRRGGARGAGARR